MASKWKRVSYGARENPGCYDTGNGAIAVVMENIDYPGIERVTVSSYAKGRGPDYTYYRRADDARGAFVLLTALNLLPSMAATAWLNRDRRFGAHSWDTLQGAVRGDNA